jgi:hypothetical protein
MRSPLSLLLQLTAATLTSSGSALGVPPAQCLMEPQTQIIQVPSEGFVSLPGDELLERCEEVPGKKWTRNPSGPIDLMVHADGSGGSGRYWEVTVGFAKRNQHRPLRGVCLTTSTVGWRTLERYKTSSLPWLDDLDGDGKAELIIWGSFPLTKEASMLEFGLMAWVYRVSSEDLLAIDWILSRRMAREIAEAYRGPLNESDLDDLGVNTAQTLEAFARGQCTPALDRSSSVVQSVVAEADITAVRLEVLIKGSGRRQEVEELHTLLRELAGQLQSGSPADARRLQQRARELWVLYTPSLANLRGLCKGCPPLDIGSLVKELESARALGSGDYELGDVREMREQRLTSTLTADLTDDGVADTALVGRGGIGVESKTFLLVVSRRGAKYRRLYFQTLDQTLPVLGVGTNYLIVTENYYPSDDFSFLCWTGSSFDLRYIGDFMTSEPCPRRGRLRARPRQGHRGRRERSNLGKSQAAAGIDALRFCVLRKNSSIIALPCFLTD